ncbi:hypothetical protein SAMN05444673_6886 [Bacillus sp. OV166]|nr:hypothetical protein SAMN05444673_6886 [Bacillus sp. OV166]
MGIFHNGIKFASTLEKSCLVSRIHPKGVEQPKDYFKLLI